MKLFSLIFPFLLIVACNEAETSNKKTLAASNLETKKATVENYDAPKILIDTSITLDFLMGKFEPTKHADFTKIGKKYANRGGMHLQKTAYESFKKMHAAAKQAGINLVIKSATRNFISQKGIWEAKWNGTRKIENGKDAKKTYPDPKTRALKILEYSSMPSTSRHHWGTDIDLNNFTNKYFEKGQGKKEYDWLNNNAHTFGFYQPYTPKDAKRPDGYNEEKWHWSYLPLSKKYIDQMKLRMKDEAIKGFQGAEVAKEIGVVEKYILGINQACL